MPSSLIYRSMVYKLAQRTYVVKQKLKYLHQMLFELYQDMQPVQKDE